MQAHMNISQGMRLDQKLSAQTVLTAQILQMNSMELEAAIQQELEINPLLELDDSSDKDDETSEADGDSEEEASYEYQYEAADKGLLDKPEKSSDLDWDNYFQDGFKDTEPEDFSRRDPDEDDWERPQSYELDIEEYLLKQLKDRSLPEKINEYVRYLIGCVGDNGFLRDEGDAKGIQIRSTDKNPAIKAINEVLQNENLLSKAPKHVQEAFNVLRSFEPPGIGAFDLRDCLLIQARRIPDFPAISLEILENHYDLLLELRYMQLAKAMNISVQDVNNAIKEFSQLNPYPLSQIQASKFSYVTPEFIVDREKDGSFSVSLRDGTKSKLKINDSYRSLLKTKIESGEKTWIRNKLNSANIFMRSIESRRETMMLVMNSIIRHQYDFFARGPEHLKPMILQDIADEVKRDISTVNRVTNGKYVQTAYGIFELKRFFSSGVAQDDGTEVSNVKIKNSIKSIIDNEDKKSPLSDQEISELLEKRGLKVARRTVNKYREAMGILPVKVRRGG